MKYNICLSIVVFTVFLVSPCFGDYFFPSPFCYYSTINNNTTYYNLAYHSKMVLDDPTGWAVPRIAIWEPDRSNNCDWAIPFETTYVGSPAAMYVQLEFDYFVGALGNTQLGIYFSENKTDYYENWGPTGIETNSVRIYDWDTWPYKGSINDPVVYGYTTAQLYGTNPPWYRLWYSTIEVLNDPNYLPPNGHAAYDPWGWISPGWRNCWDNAWTPGRPRTGRPPTGSGTNSPPWVLAFRTVPMGRSGHSSDFADCGVVAHPGLDKGPGFLL